MCVAMHVWLHAWFFMCVCDECGMRYACVLWQVQYSLCVWLCVPCCVYVCGECGMRYMCVRYGKYSDVCV